MRKSDNYKALVIESRSAEAIQQRRWYLSRWTRSNYRPQARKPAASSQQALRVKAPYFFFAALNFAHRAFCAAAIFLRADADIVRLAGIDPFVFAATGCDPFRTFIHLAFCASAIFRREAADIILFGWFVFRDVPEPFNDSIAEIA